MPFDKETYRWYFKDKAFYGIKTVGMIRERFPKWSLDDKKSIVDLISECLTNEDTQFTSIRAAITILRKYNGFNPTDFARRAVLKHPTNDLMRKTYANTLDVLFQRPAHLEAFKQRLIACMLDIKDSLKNPQQTKNPQEIFITHFKRVDWIKDFLLGSKKYPTSHFMEYFPKKIIPDPEITALLNKLILSLNKCNLPIIPEKKAGVNVIVDCNVLSNPEISSQFIDPIVHYMIPTEVLFEFSNWKQVTRIPIELDAVEVLDVKGVDPPEVENMFSPMKRSIPSITDKRIATLALEQNADAIITADRDIYDGGFEGQVMQNYNKNIEVIIPKYYLQWLKKKKELS